MYFLSSLDDVRLRVASHVTPLYVYFGIILETKKTATPGDLVALGMTV
jgi:hypothetical protein